MEPTKRVLLSIFGYLVGALVASMIAVSVIAAGGWEINVSASIGSEAGRAVRQIGQGVPLDDLRVPAAVSALLNVPLWGALIGTPLLARRWGLDWRRDLGWAMTRTDVVFGTLLGVATQFFMIPLYQIVFAIFGDLDVEGPARSLVASVDTPLDLAALVFMTVVMAPLAEEIAFRGLMFRGIRDMEAGRAGSGVVLAAIVSSLVFAASHFQLVQFPGLFVFGLVAAAAFQRTGRLGTAIWIHVGFNLTTVVLLLG